MSSNCTCHPRFVFRVASLTSNVIPCHPLPPSDTLVITNGLSTDRIRLVAAWGTFTAVEVHASRATRALQSRSQSVYGDVGALLSRRASRCTGVTICCFVIVSQIAATTICWRWFKNLFEAKTQDELIEQELDPLMREALLAVDPEGSGALQSDEGSVPTRRHQEEVWCEKISSSGDTSSSASAETIT